MKGLQNLKRTNRKQDQNKIYFNANISLRTQRKSAFIAKTVRHCYFITNVQNVCRLQKHKQKSTETLAPLFDGVVDDTLVHALPLLSDALPQLIQNPDILSVDAFMEHAPYTIVHWI